MPTFRKFEDIEAWQKGLRLVAKVYKCSSSGAIARDYAFCDQIRRAACSVTSNIAEGFERGGPAEFARFLSIAKGSVGEIRSLLHVASAQEYMSKDVFNDLYRDADEVGRMIGGLIVYLKKAKQRGRKSDG